MSFIVPLGIITLTLWSLAIRVNRIDRLRPYVVGFQTLLLLVSIIFETQIIEDHWFVFGGSTLIFLLFCFPYQKICNKQDNYSVRYAMLLAIMTGGVIVGLILEPLNALPLVFSAAIFHLYQKHITAYLIKQSREMLELKEQVRTLNGRVSLSKLLVEIEEDHNEKHVS